MGLCDSTRCWRWQHGSAAAFKAGVAALLLGLTLAQTAPPQTKCPAVAAQSNLTEVQYHNITDEDYSGFLSAFVQSFLNTVQPNPFPKEIVVRMIKDLNQVLSNQDLIKDALEYQVGFLVCAAIGVLYIVLMPIVGLFLACCRCCGNCGGKMYQKQTSSVHCHRRALFWSAFITTAIILAGNICMFKSNEALKVTIDQTADGLSKTFDNINTFLSAVPEEMSHVVNESYKTIQEVTRNLETIGPQLGAQIQEAFRDTIEPALNSVRLLDEDTENTSDQLNKLNSSLAELQSSVDRLQANVTAVKDHINQTLSSPDCTGCDKLLPELQELDTLDTTIIIPSAKELQFAVDEVMKINLSSKVKEVEDYFNSIPQRVTNDTEDIVQSSRKLLDDIRAQIVKIADIPLATLDNITDTLDEARREIARIIPQLERGERIRWGVCVALCCLVLLVVACYFMGMILGPLGLKPNADPRKRSCTADSGGTFLMMGAGFSFLFSWLFMILVLVLFLLGGNIYTLVCRPWDNGQLLKLLDTPGLIPGFDSIGPSLGLKSRVNISDIYKACERDEPLWTTLHLDEVIDLDDTLNVSKYTDQILNYFDDVDITLSTLTLLSPDIKDQLSSFSGKADDFDAVDITPQINNVSRINLNSTADKLDQLASLQTNNNTKKELQDQARELRQIQAAIETALIPQMENINTSVAGLRFIAQKINGTVGEVLSNVGAAQDFLNTNTTQIVKTESKEFVDCQMGYFFVYADWAKLTITVHIGRCGPVADVVDFFESLICLNLVESLNAFWFSLGWCMIFFVPGIIFSIKLAKYYRKMKYSDVFEENLTMSHIPRAHVKIS